MPTRRFHNLVFDDSMRTARSDAGEDLAFTRQERAVLLELTRRPGTLLGRREIARVLARTGRPSGARNVDFLINRLRSRLNDSAREPRFIATQYGEGYVWVAPSEAPEVSSAFVVIGPIAGADAPEAAEALAVALQRELAAIVGPSRTVAAAPRRQPRPNPDIGYAIEASLHAEGRTLHAAFILREGATQRVLATRRAMNADGRFNGEARELAHWAKDSIWRHMAMPVRPDLQTPDDVPAEVRMHDAALALTRTPESWRETEAQLSRARAENPDDPQLAILWAMNLFNKLIHWPGGMMLAPDDRRSIEDEIETLVFDHLPAIDDNPLLKLAAAKLLFYIDRGYLDLAGRLADDAFTETTAFGAAYATRAQILMCRGAIADAIALYDKAIAGAEFGSEFHIYLLVLKLTALMADNDRAAVARTAEEMYLARPETRWLALFVVSPYEPPPPDVEAALGAMAPAQAHGILAHLHQVSGRHFVAEHHRANVMRGAALHIQNRLGPAAIPDEIARLLAAAPRANGA